MTVASQQFCREMDVNTENHTTDLYGFDCKSLHRFIWVLPEWHFGTAQKVGKKQRWSLEQETAVRIYTYCKANC